MFSHVDDYILHHMGFEYVSPNTKPFKEQEVISGMNARLEHVDKAGHSGCLTTC